VLEVDGFGFGEIAPVSHADETVLAGEFLVREPQIDGAIGTERV